MVATSDPDHAPDMSEYNVMLGIREEYFDAPNLGRLISGCLDNPGLCVTGRIKALPPGMWRWIVIQPDCEDILKELIWAFSDFARDHVVCGDPKARYLAGNPWYPSRPATESTAQQFPAFAQPS